MLRALLRRLRAVSMLLALALVFGVAGPAAAQSRPVDIPQMRVERGDDGLYLSAAVDFDLPALVEEALYKGIPVFFVAQASVLRDRWYWTDERLATAQRYMRLAYQPLTRRWRLHVAPTPIGNSGLGMALSQNYDDLGDALEALKRIARWRIADLGLMDADNRYSVEFRFRLDTNQLPRPLQMGIAGRSDWSLSADRSLPLETEAGP